MAKTDISKHRVFLGISTFVLLSLQLFLGCGDSSAGGGFEGAYDASSDSSDPIDAVVMDSALDAAEADGSVPRPRFQVCQDDPLPTGLSTVEWDHAMSSIITLGDPGHSAQDVITVVGEAASIVGKFTYGVAGTDLEDEWVEVWLDVCQGQLVRLGQVKTNSDGRAALEIPAQELPPVGAYATWLRVMGDSTSTRSMLRVVLPQTRAAVMDIDGTLTTADTELFQDVFADLFAPLGTGDYVPEARAGAVNLTLGRGPQQGYLLIYLTGRPYWLTDTTRGWIADMGLGPAHLHLTDSNGEAMPTNGAVGTYKADYLAFLEGLGIILELAYGNATTDIYAYEQAGMDKARTFIVGSHGGEEGTVDLGDDYIAHLQAIATEPFITQPFDW